MNLAKDGPSLRAGGPLPIFCVARRLRTTSLVRFAPRALKLGQNTRNQCQAMLSSQRLYG